jgi:hypothetical protein
MHLELSNGNSAELLDDLSGITNDQRDAIDVAYGEALWEYDAAVGKMVDRASEIRKLKAMNRRLTELAVISWTLPEPIPSKDPSVLGRINAADGLALENAAMAMRYTAKPIDTTLEAVEKGPDGAPQRDAPFLPSSASPPLSSTAAATP